MQLYDTARRAVVAFEPNDHVLMYTCGITPYDATHLGHAATFIAYDVLQRRLIDRGHTVQLRPQRHRRRRSALRQGPPTRGALPRSRRRRGGPLRARHDGAQRAAGLVDAAGVVGDPRHPRVHRHGARSGLRLRGRRLGLLRRVEVRLVRHAEPLHRTTRCCCSPRSAAATSTTRTSARRSTSCSGTRRPPTSRRGTRCGAPADRAGTSSARRSRCASSARRSTCTAGEPT